MEVNKEKKFFEHLNLPKLSKENMGALERPITLEELEKTIKLLPNGKTPGIDGIPCEFYKKFAEVLGPEILKTFNAAIDTGWLPPSMTESIITLILKKDKDPLECGSYRPISLLCCDVKLLTKLFALRLNNIIKTIIHPDQVGFVKGRAASDGLRRLLHLIWKAKDMNIPVAALSLDAEKAFDRVSWSYLIFTLKEFGFGLGFQNIIKLIYKEPKSQVVVNGLRSSAFLPGRGTKQGDPLSPLLFIIALEPLAEAIRLNQSIRGVTMGGRENKMLIFADDILVLMSDPHSSVPSILDLVRSFSDISGYKINWTKSEVMPLSKYCYRSNFQNWKFQWMPKNLKYLGIILNPGLENIIHDNFTPVLNKIHLLLKGWDKLQISLWGRVQAVKMVIAPKLNYLLSMLPLSVPPTIFQ